MDEYIESLQRLLQEHQELSEFRYFINQAMNWYQSIRNGLIGSRIVIIGTGIPEELIMASGEVPFRILGGSHTSCLWSDSLVPRDTDPVSRSVLGYIQCLKDVPGILYILPSYSDSMRKIASQLLEDGQNVQTVDLPPVRPDTLSEKTWIRQMFHLTQLSAEHVHGKLTAISMKEAIRVTSRARIALHEFSLMAPEHDMLLSPAAATLIRNSYYYTCDLVLWTERLRALMNELKHIAAQKGLQQSDKPRILLMGSPVYFPNDKIPRLLTESGLRIWRQADASESIGQIIPKIGRNGHSLRKMIETVALAWHKADTSPAYLKNEVMRRRIRLEQNPWTGQPVEGVVYHVLKGQIEQDFELAYYEELMEQARIPVFRLETDYQYQDVEQLRIRMEAFTEMLNQNRYRSRREAV